MNLVRGRENVMKNDKMHMRKERAKKNCGLSDLPSASDHLEK